MPKVNVSLPQEILSDLDKAARESQDSRSAFLAKAVRHYLEGMDKEKQKEKRKQAVAEMDRFREKFGGWDGTDEVLKWRDKH